MLNAYCLLPLRKALQALAGKMVPGLAWAVRCPGFFWCLEYTCQPTWHGCHPLRPSSQCLLALITLSHLPDLDPVLLILTRVSMLSSFPSLFTHLTYRSLKCEVLADTFFRYDSYHHSGGSYFFLNFEFGFFFYSSFLKSRVSEDDFKKSHGPWDP